MQKIFDFEIQNLNSLMYEFFDVVVVEMFFDINL